LLKAVVDFKEIFLLQPQYKYNNLLLGKKFNAIQVS